MRPNVTPQIWIRAVMKSDLTARTKVVLSVMANNHMRLDMKVSVPRAAVAKEVRGSTRQVDRAIAEAFRGGWIDVVHRGQKHRTAVYQGIISTGLRATDTNALRPATSVALKRRNQALRATHAVAPVVKRNLLPVVTERNEERQDEQPPATEADGRVWDAETGRWSA